MLQHPQFKQLWRVSGVEQLFLLIIAQQYRFLISVPKKINKKGKQRRRSRLPNDKYLRNEHDFVVFEG
jgi:hypothetical protein